MTHRSEIYKIDRRVVTLKTLQVLTLSLISSMFYQYLIGCVNYARFHKSSHIRTVPLNYNFIFTCISMRGATQYFACEIPKLEICISTRRDMALP